MNLKGLSPSVVVCWVLLGCGQEPDATSLFMVVEEVVYFDCREDTDNPIDQGELESLLAKHKKYLDSDGAEGEFANLCNANLRNSDLQWKNLSRANLVDAKLSWTVLMDAKLNGADLTRADLRGANLAGADLSGAILFGADLSGANLENAILTNTVLSGAYMSGVTYVPQKQPNAEDIAQAKCLHLLKRDDSNHDPRGLVALRNLFQADGYRKQERQVTFALKHSDFFTQRPVDGQETRDDPECFEYATEKRADKGLIETRFNYLLFELPTAWGMHPSRALAVLFALIPIFAVPYAFALRLVGSDGIWRIWSSERARKDQGSDNPELMVTGFPGAIRSGLHFSLISAFHLGWRDFNVGNWISRLQTREYSLRASGWVRTVAGIQSLISVYLLAMWALTYFGRPFQ